MKRKLIFPAMIFMLLTTRSYGYIDPGTGSYLVQVIIAAAAGAALGIKLYWKKIKALFTRLYSKKNTTTTPNP